MELGKTQVLTVVRKVEFGVYLGTDEEQVLLPKKQVPEGVEPGDPVEVFLYRDSDDRMIATTTKPKIQLGELAVLSVADTGKIGAFLDWGLEKDLLLPFKEQTGKLEPKEECLVTLYVDKSGRLCATQKVYHLLQTDAPYHKDDQVEGIIYDTSDNYGVFVAVDDRYSALIPRREAFGNLKVGRRVRARVIAVREDGKLDLSVREKTPVQMDVDAKQIFETMERQGGELEFTDKASPEVIREKFQMSKNEFKRAVGRLLKEGKVEIKEKTIAIKGR